MSTLREKIYKTKCAKPEIFEWYSKKGVTSIFIYSRNVLKNGVISTYDDENKSVRSVQKGGEIFVPASFFEKYLDLAVKTEGNTVSISRGKKTLSATLGECEYSVSDKVGKFVAPVFFLDGYIYLPAIKCAEALGVSCRAFDGGKMIIFAKKELLDEIERDTELEVSASYATVGKYDASKFTKQDFEVVKNKWRTVLVGNEEINDLSDPDFKEKLAEISERTRSVWNALHKEKDRFILWGDNPPSASSDLTRQYSNIWALTQGFAIYGSDYYKNEELKATIIDCFQWMYENMYGEAEIEDRGWRSMKIFNWWDWFWGGIEPMTNALMVMEEHLTLDQIKTWLRAFKHVLTIHRLGYRRECAMSRLTVCTKAALLLEDRAMLENECADYDLTLNVTRTEEGAHVDYVEWTHGFPYNMMYGFNNLSRGGFVGTLLGGTPMEYISPKQYELYNIAKYMFEAACYKGQGFMGFNGRGTAGTEFGCGVTIMNGVLPFIGLFGEEEDMHLKKLIKRCASTPKLIKMLKSACSVYNFAKLMEILRDDSISAVNDYELGHAWFTADRFVQHRNDYAFFLAMPSSRHPSYESINSANKRGWYTCDGAVYYYNDTDRAAYDGVNFIMNPELCQRVAGTTVDARERQPWSYRSGWRPSTAFSGTMDVLKKYGMGAFEYESYHYEGHEADGTEDKDYGGGFTFWENDLTARKSYYFFDKECVCLGAGINSTMNSNVLTTLEHRRLVKNKDPRGAEDVYVDGALMPKDDFEVIKNDPEWIHLEGFAGYVLPAGGVARVSKYKHVPNTSGKDDYFVSDPDGKIYENGKPFFEINLYHGENPKDASYEYIVLPNATPEETKAYSATPEVEIIKNTKKCQAVRKEALGLTFITFFEAGECCGIKANAPCIVSVLEKDGVKTVSVADPTQKLSEVKLTLDKRYALLSAPIIARVDQKRGVSVITAKTEELACEPVRVSFKV
ncbi:MAG: hypothetical protein IKB38_09910 [Clostridia bacterium]|nr:hypothetical protein [Clostridia bacterium]